MDQQTGEAIGGMLAIIIPVVIVLGLVLLILAILIPWFIYRLHANLAHMRKTLDSIATTLPNMPPPTALPTAKPVPQRKLVIAKPVPARPRVDLPE